MDFHAVALSTVESVIASEVKESSGELEIPADEWLSIGISCTKGEAVIDDVMVEPVKIR